MKPHQLRRALKNSPNRCPYCDSHKLKVGRITEEEAGTIVRHVSCGGDFSQGGEGSWREVYPLPSVRGY